MTSKKYKIWLDDIRPMPPGFDVHCKTGDRAIRFLSDDAVSEISLDHDLGEGMTGYDVAKFVEKAAFLGTLSRIKWAVHSSNPVGKSNIESAMLNAEKWWAYWDKTDRE